MATSSIFTNIVINDPKKAKKFIDALETSSHDPAWELTTPVKPPLTDIEVIRKLMAKRGSSVSRETQQNISGGSAESR